MAKYESITVKITPMKSLPKRLRHLNDEDIQLIIGGIMSLAIKAKVITKEKL